MIILRDSGSIQCECNTDSLENAKTKLHSLISGIIDSTLDPDIYTHIDFEPIPSQENVIQIINRLRNIIFPGFFNITKPPT